MSSSHFTMLVLSMLKSIISKYLENSKVCEDYPIYLLLFYTKVVLARYIRKVDVMSTCDV